MMAAMSAAQSRSTQTTLGGVESPKRLLYVGTA